MDKVGPQRDINELRCQLEEDLLKLYGPVLTGESLFRSLGYVSKDAFKQSMSRKTVPVQLFAMQNKRGKYALTSDVARYLAEQFQKSVNSRTKSGD
jgi:hypothetical protein